MLMVRALDVIRPLHELVGLVIIALALPAVTVGPVDPAVVHPLACKAMAVDSAAVPLLVRGGENVSEPLMSEQVMPPEAVTAVVVVAAAAAELVLVLELGPELQLAASVATSPMATSSSNLDVRNVDTGSFSPVASARTLSALSQPRR